MPPNNIWGRLPAIGLTNPLQEDLLAGDFNALDFNEVHLNELHNNSGTGNIIVHEQLNMTNKKITNLADPVASKDAVNLSYYEANLPSSSTPYYDLMAAFGDETTPISAGVQPMRMYPPRDFTATFITGTLSIVATSNNFQVQVFKGGTQIGTLSFLGGSPIATGSITSATYLTSDLITAVCPSADATAAGLKITINGNQI